MTGGIVALYPKLDNARHTADALSAFGSKMLPGLSAEPAESAAFGESYAGERTFIGRLRPDRSECLAINQARQPIWDETRQICLVFHGELFGYQSQVRALAQAGHSFGAPSATSVSPAEYVLHLYQEAGDRFVQSLNGSFSLALWDSRAQTLIVANDRYGLCPLYGARLSGLPDGEATVWASRPQAILAAPSFRRQLNVAALADFLTLGVPQSGDTMFVGITEVPPASLITCTPDGIRSRQYWDLELEEQDRHPPADEYLEELIRLLRQAGRRRQTGAAGQPPDLVAGLTLSGGHDSRVLLSLVDQNNLKAFTYGTPSSDDMRFARQAARAAHVQHIAVPIQPDYLVRYAQIGIQRTEDLLNCDQYHGISAYDEIASQVQAVIAGSVGEDVLGYFCRDPNSRYWSSEGLADRFYDAHTAMTDDDLSALFAPAYAQQMSGLARARFHADFERCATQHNTHRHDYWCMRQQQRRLYNRLASLFPGNLLFRPLYLDNDVVDFAQNLPPRLRWGRESLVGRILLHTAPELARLPLTTTGGLPLTASLAQIERQSNQRRRRARWHRRASRLSKGLIAPPGQPHAYADYATWLRRELKPWAEWILLDRRTLERGYWRPPAIRLLLQDHQQGRGRRSARKLTSLISFELWHRAYLD